MLTNRFQPICIIALLACAAAPALAADAPNSTSYIFQDYGNVFVINQDPELVASVEFLLQSDKSTYISGEPVDLLFSITNHGPHPLSWYLSPYHSLTAYQDDAPVWFLGGQFLVMGGTSLFQLGVGEVQEIRATWDMTDDRGTAILPGNYEIHSGLGGLILPITIVPEPSTLASFLLGAALLLARHLRRHRYNRRPL